MDRFARGTHRSVGGSRQLGEALADRRATERLQEAPPVFVLGLRATVHDVSRAGICLSMAELPEQGSRVRLTLLDAQDDSSLQVDAEVVWCADGRAGFRWVDLTPEQDRWLLRHFQRWLAARAGASRR